MIRLPSGVDINNLINDLRILSWEAADILIYYSNLFKDQSNNINLVKNNSENPVTLADLKVNELIIKSINQIYKDINWGILSEENTKVNSLNLKRIVMVLDSRSFRWYKRLYSRDWKLCNAISPELQEQSICWGSSCP